MASRTRASSIGFQQPQHTPSGTRQVPNVGSTYSGSTEPERFVNAGISAGGSGIGPSNPVHGVAGGALLSADETAETEGASDTLPVLDGRYERRVRRGVASAVATAAATISAGVSVSKETW